MNRILFTLAFLSVFFSAKAQTKVACIGNSITYGYGLSSPVTQSYPSRLQALLGNSYQVSNFGVSARTLLKNGDRPYWNESQYTQSLALNPDVVIIMLGTNDAKLNTNWQPHKNEFVDDYKTLIHSYQNLSSKPQVWVCQIVPAYQTIWEISDATIKNEVNPKIKEVALDEGLSLIDLYTEMSNKKSMFQADGIHPNATGAQAMANFIFQIFKGDTLTIRTKGDSLIAPTGIQYQWYLNNEILADSLGGKFKIIEAKVSGDYKVGVTLHANSKTTILSRTLTHVVIPEKANSIEDANVLKVYPNPGANELILENLSKELTEVRLYDLEGKQISNESFTPEIGSYQFNVSSVPNGVYQLSVSTKTSVHRTKVIIRH